MSSKDNDAPPDTETSAALTEKVEREAAKDPIVGKLGQMKWKVPGNRSSIPSADTGPAQKPSFEPEVIRMTKERDYIGIFLNALPIIVFFARVLMPQVCLCFVHVGSVHKLICM